MSVSRPLAGLVLVAGLGFASALGASCSEPDDQGGLGGGPLMYTAIQSATFAATTVGPSTGAVMLDPEPEEPNPCLPAPLPDGVPHRWEHYKDWSCKCRLYVPKEPEALPPPIQWEACPPLPGGVACKRMTIDWSSEKAPIPLHGISFDAGPGRSAVIQFRRIIEDPLTAIDLVAEVDGPVRSAIINALPPNRPDDAGCYIFSEGVNEGMMLYSAKGSDTFAEGTDSHEGALGGPIDDRRPPVLLHFIDKNAFDDGWTLGAKWFVQVTNSAIYAHPWDMSKKLFVMSTATDPEGADPGMVVVRGDAIFWNSSSLYQNGINVWDPVHGARPFVRWVGDFTRGADDFATDGVDMVWAYGEGKKPLNHIYPVRWIMTAPFTKDPERIKPRRLRSHLYHKMGHEPFVVGCGYAAHKALGTEHVSVFVVRLSDGRAWVVPHTPELEARRVLGVTCEEVFFLGDIAGQWNIGRVRIDSLGPGIPADQRY